MRKTIAITLAIGLAVLLFGCDLFGGGKDDPTTVPETTGIVAPTAAPPPPGGPAVMAPLQGGPMLYPFHGTTAYKTEISEYDGEEYPFFPLGLIDQDGKLVSPAIYHKAEYITGADGRVTGLVATLDREFTLYQLDGQTSKLACDGYRIEVHPGGRYATVHAAAYGDTEGWDYADPLKDGIFDLERNRFILDPVDGQMLQHRAGDVVFGYRFDGLTAEGSEIAQFVFNCADGSKKDIPMALGRIQVYFPETGWFSAWLEEHVYYDKDLKPLENLNGWTTVWGGFNGGEYCAVYNNPDYPEVQTWINRQGELSGGRFTEIYNSDGWDCWLSGNTFDWETKAGTLIDADLNDVAVTGPGEKLTVLRDLNSGTDRAIVHMAADGAIKAAYDLAAKPMQAPQAFRCWFDMDTSTLYAAENGAWRVLDLTPFAPKPRREHRGGYAYAAPAAACADFVVVETGVHWYEASTTYDIFALDWNGKRISGCPLEPFFELLNPWNNAGPQGPDYFWIENGTQRGYINVKGEWVFVE